jgi:thiol-disulfide isomerase/thioredoxin
MCSIVPAMVMMGPLICLSAANVTSKPATTVPDVPAIVRGVREQENTFHKLKSLYLRIDSSWRTTPQGIAARLAEIKKQFPDTEPTPENFGDLRPEQKDTLEIAFDQRRVRVLWDMQGRSHDLRIWDGTRAIVHEHYFSNNQEHYALDREPNRFIGENVMSHLSCLRAGPHSFWWKKETPAMDFYGEPEQFRFVRREKYRGEICDMLEFSPRWRWYVSVKDHRIRAFMSLNSGRVSMEHWMEDYREIAPEVWFPYRQGYIFYEQNKRKQNYVSSSREMKIVELKANTPLSDDLFKVTFREGVQVNDWGHDPPLLYKYKASMPAEEYQAIIDKAGEKKRSFDKGEAERKSHIGQKAPPLPTGDWCNSRPLTWEKLKGKRVILEFWSVSCGPCKNDFPHLNALYRQRADDLVIIGVHIPEAIQLTSRR